MIWYRVDNRLVHGQIIEAWLPYLNATVLVVANEALVNDELRRRIMLMAVPGRIRLLFVRLADLPVTLARCEEHKESVLVLFADPADARWAYDHGTPLRSLNIGNLHYKPGKRQVCEHAALSPTDEENLRYLRGQRVELDYRCVPADQSKVKDWQ